MLVRTFQDRNSVFEVILAEPTEAKGRGKRKQSHPSGMDHFVRCFGFIFLFGVVSPRPMLSLKIDSVKRGFSRPYTSINSERDA